MQFTLLVFSLFFSISLFAQTLRIGDIVDPNNSFAYGNSSSTIIPHNTFSGDGTSYTSRFFIYVAVSSDGTVTPAGGAASDTGIYHVNAASALPQASSSAITSGVVDIDILYNTSGNTMYLMAMTSNLDSNSSEPSDWTYYNPLTTSNTSFGTVSSSTDTAVTVRLNLATICGSDHLNCGSFDGSLREERQIFLYLDTEAQTNGENDGAQPTNHQNGIYIELNISDNPPNGTANTPNLDSIDRGDASLTLNYSSGTSAITDFLEVRACQSQSNFDDSDDTDEDPIETTNCSLTSDLFDPNSSGAITVGDLENSTEYFFAVSFVDKFRFGTSLSEVRSETPLAVDALLDSNQCFIATAAYKRDNYVVKYLRNFRDQVLLQNDFGKKFVEYYYEFSPPLAQVILKSPLLRAIVRPIVYLFYFTLKYWWFFATLTIFFVVAVSIFWRLQKEKSHSLQ